MTVLARSTDARHEHGRCDGIDCRSRDREGAQDGGGVVTDNARIAELEQALAECAAHLESIVARADFSPLTLRLFAADLNAMSVRAQHVRSLLRDDLPTDAEIDSLIAWLEVALRERADGRGAR